MPDPIVKVVIPAQNEERAIGKVISESTRSRIWPRLYGWYRRGGRV